MPNVIIGPRNTYTMYIDDADVSVVMQYKWYFKKLRTVVCTAPEQIPLTHLLLNPPTGMVVDHIDGNQLNNSRSNLRICTQADNAKNRRTASNVQPLNGRWRARICHNYVNIHIGMFDTREEAELAVRDMKRELYGEYAPC